MHNKGNTAKGQLLKQVNSELAETYENAQFSALLLDKDSRILPEI